MISQAVKKYGILLILLYLWFGYVLNNLLHLSFIDELFEVFFLVAILLKRERESKICMAVFFFYLLYSFFFSENPSVIGQLVDFVQQIKPFVFFYFFYCFEIYLSSKYMTVLKFNVFVAVALFLISFIVYGDGGGLIWHPLVLGVSCFCFAMVFYYISNESKINKLLTIIILMIGLLSLRGKYIGEFLISFTIILIVKKTVKFNLKYLLIFSTMACLVFYFVADKWHFYFVQSDGAARYILYKYMPTMLIDHLPFGTGLASYATYASGTYYSPLYYKYGLSGYHGMSPHFYEYIADTYFPVLAQFGIVGVFLFFAFWLRRYNDVLHIATYDIKKYKIGLMVIFMLFIESVAGPVLVMNWGFIPMMLLGMICNKEQLNYEKITSG